MNIILLTIKNSRFHKEVIGHARSIPGAVKAAAQLAEKHFINFQAKQNQTLAGVYFASLDKLTEGDCITVEPDTSFELEA